MIDDFLSHDWETSRRDKFLALVWAFNARPAVIATLGRHGSSMLIMLHLDIVSGGFKWISMDISWPF